MCIRQLESVYLQIKRFGARANELQIEGVHRIGKNSLGITQRFIVIGIDNQDLVLSVIQFVWKIPFVVVNTQTCKSWAGIGLVVTKTNRNNRIITFHYSTQKSKIQPFRTGVHAAVILPNIRRSELVVPRIIRLSQIKRKDQSTLPRKIVPVGLHIGANVVCIDIRLQVRTTDVVKVQFAVLAVYHGSKVTIQLLPILGIRRIKSKTVFGEIDERIFVMQVCVNIQESREKVGV